MLSNINVSLLKAKLYATAVHAIFTIAVAILTAWVVYGLWYPNGLSGLSGGTELYKLVVLVELCLGPLISLIIFNPEKSRKKLVCDYACVAIIQFSALAYGLYAVASARPVFLVFVKDRIEVVSAVELLDEDLALADEKQFSTRSFSGPVVACYDRPTDSEELSDIMFTAVAGKDVHLRPEYYRSCQSNELVNNATKLSELSLSSYETELVSELELKNSNADLKSIPLSQTGRFWTLVFSDERLDEFLVVPIDSYGR